MHRRYTISQNMMDRKYEFHVDVSACYEPLSCDQVVSILNQTSFDMKRCTYQGGFLNSSKYSASYKILWATLHASLKMSLYLFARFYCWIMISYKFPNERLWTYVLFLHCLEYFSFWNISQLWNCMETLKVRQTDFIEIDNVQVIVRVC